MSSVSEEVLSDLAFLYISVAQNTDDEFSPDEAAAIRRRLEAWADRRRAQIAVELAVAAVAAEQEPAEALHRVAVSLGDALEASDRARALNDLVEIANADGRFLDAEENVLNALMSLWDVDPSVLYAGR